MKALTLSYPRSSAIAVTGLPAASSSRALSKRIRCRHSLKLKPVSARNRRVSVRDYMPAQAAHSSNLRPSSGFADSACAILSNRLSCGIGSPRLTLGREPISSRITPAKRFWDALSSTPCHAAARVIASRSRLSLREQMAYQVARHRLWQKHKHSILNMDRASAGRAEHLAVSRRHVLPVPPSDNHRHRP
ncbi:Uncharacterised protein [Klebsiella pneumoniae]|uniref:Uncharacterized protein n=1 Tax=Klebsiella pneumoniae TaxID=573 RepID=A0A2X3IW98_KLEPN|nr:Uncharacterised protein [Klebsiella pneumoniae]